MRKQSRIPLGFLMTPAEVCVIVLHGSNVTGIKWSFFSCLSLNINDFERFPCFCDSCICTLSTVSLAFILLFFFGGGPLNFFHKLLRDRVGMLILYTPFCCPIPVVFFFFLDLNLGLLCTAGCFFDSVYKCRLGSKGRGFMGVGRRTPRVEVTVSARDL